MEAFEDDYVTLCQIYNLRVYRSASHGISYLSYYCSVENCTYKTESLADLFSHFDNHKEKWYGFCCACNAQVRDKNGARLLEEVKHWNKFHKSDIGINVSTSDNKTNHVTAIEGGNLNVYDDDFQLCVKPWLHSSFKSQTNCRKMLNEASLAALYKCMGANCAFSTSIENEMLMHLQEIHAVSETETDSTWLECAYCDLIAESCSSLVQHVTSNHGSSSYQCSNCFYRSCSADNVVFHATKFHGSQTVLVCPGKELHAKSLMADVEENRRKNVFPLRCSEVCERITFVMDDFIIHVTNSTQHNGHFKCQFCGLKIPICDAIEHLLLHHIGVYQCIYCIYGANDVECIQNHMCHTHPNRLPLICVRLTKKSRVLRDEELTSVASTMLCNLTQTIDSKFFKRCSFDYSNCQSLDASTLDILSFDDLITYYTSDDWTGYFEKLLEHRKVECMPDVEMGDGISSRVTFDSLPDVEMDHGDESESIKERTADFDGFEVMFNITEVETINVLATTETNDTVQANLLTVVKLDENDNQKVLDTLEYKDPPKENVRIVSRDDVVKNDIQSENMTKPKKKSKVIEVGHKRHAKRVKADQQRKSTEVAVKTELNLSDAFQYRCVFCPKLCKAPNRVFEHWKKEHERPSSAFMFKIIKIFQCCYCRTSTIYNDLKYHCAQKHSKHVFAFFDKANPTRCVMCSHHIGNASIIDHFTMEHNHPNKFGINDPISLGDHITDELLDKILAEDIPLKTVRTDVHYGCPNCPSSGYHDQFQIVSHIRSHLKNFQCNICTTKFDGIEILRKHHQCVHKNESERYQIVDAAEHLDTYLGMKIIFSNGLVLTKREAANTRYGAMDEVIKKVNEINATELETVRKRQMDTESSAATKKMKLDPKNVDKKRVPLKPHLQPIQNNGHVEQRTRRQNNPKSTERKESHSTCFSRKTRSKTRSQK